MDNTDLARLRLQPRARAVLDLVLRSGGTHVHGRRDVPVARALAARGLIELRDDGDGRSPAMNKERWWATPTDLGREAAAWKPTPEQIAAQLTESQRLRLRTCITLTDAGNGCGAGSKVLERFGLVRVVYGARGGRLHVPTDLGRECNRILEKERLTIKARALLDDLDEEDRRDACEAVEVLDDKRPECPSRGFDIAGEHGMVQVVRGRLVATEFGRECVRLLKEDASRG